MSIKIIPKEEPPPEPLRSLKTRWHIVARNTEWFLEYVRQSGKDLQDCKPIVTEEGCRGIDFSSPLNELVVVSGWKRGTPTVFHENVYALMSRYCLQKRVHDVPVFNT